MIIPVEGLIWRGGLIYPVPAKDMNDVFPVTKFNRRDKEAKSCWRPTAPAPVKGINEIIPIERVKYLISIENVKSRIHVRDQK